MRITATLLRGLFGLITILAFVSAQPAQSPDSFDKDDFLSRKKWYVSFSLILEGKSGATKNEGADHWRTEWDIHREVSGLFELDHIGQAHPHDSVLAQGEKPAGRFISWDASVGLSTVDFFVTDRIHHESKTYGEGHAETIVSGHSSFEGIGTTQIGRFKELKCDLKDMIFDFILSDLRGWNREKTDKPLKLTGEYHSFTPMTKVHNDITYTSVQSGIFGELPEMVEPLRKQFLSRKLELKKGKIAVSASVPIVNLPTFPAHPGSIPGGSQKYNGYKTEGGSPLQLSLNVVISPTPPVRAKLLLNPINYDDWRPLCSNSETTKGNNLETEWRVEEEGGDPAKPVKVIRVVFSLLNTSKEPGVCMNYPLIPKTPVDFDLKFAPAGAPQRGYNVSSDGQKLTLTDAQASAGKGSVTVDSFDSGATGVLVAEAELEDGRVLKGTIEKNGEKELRIPDFEPGVSSIAKSWRARNAPGKKDDADDENEPVGDGQKGDGLTVWEEYRGFWSGDKWDGTCAPTTKDLFIFNEVGGKAVHGIELFATATGLRIHDDLIEGEIKRDRVVNFNHGGRPHLVDQHCIIVCEGGFYGIDDDGILSQASICNPTDNADFPGPPKNTHSVMILTIALVRTYAAEQVRNGETYSVAYADSVVAHELGHGLGIRHHGDKDDLQQWHYDRLKTGQLITYANGVEVTVREESTGTIMLTDDLFPDLAPGKKRGVWLGERNGQHSGDEACIMRYDIASAYHSQTQPKVIYYHGGDEIRGIRLCESPAGTGVNMPTHAPQSRYFGADSGRGNCLHKFVVSDHWEKIH